MNIEDLKKEIPCQWRVQSFSKDKASATIIAYIDARDVMNLLDRVVGSQNWQDDYKMVGDKFIAGIGIRCFVNDKGWEWVWKWDTGNESNEDASKGQVSDSFKRAAVKWGVGRFLYDKEIKFLKTNGAKSDTNKYPYVVDNYGNRIWDITKHIEGNVPPSTPKPLQSQPVAPQPPKDVKAQIAEILISKGIAGADQKAWLETNYPTHFKAQLFDKILDNLKA